MFKVDFIMPIKAQGNRQVTWLKKANILLFGEIENLQFLDFLNREPKKGQRILSCMGPRLSTNNFQHLQMDPPQYGVTWLLLPIVHGNQ